MADSAAVAEDVNGDSSKTFTVQFLGSQQVMTDRGDVMKPVDLLYMCKRLE